jgi:hypothetical protein
MTAAEASDLGQIVIEHNTDVMISCSRDEKAFRQELLTSVKSSQPRPTGPITIKAAATYDERKAADLFSRFVRNGTWITPTLVITGTVPAERRREGDGRMKYIPAPLQETWLNGYNASIRVLPNADDRKMRTKKMLEMVGLEHRMGVRLLAGTDAPNPYVFPGFSLHEELELLVRAGLSPLEALRTATINPAKFLGKEKEIGTIEKGKFADLVLLEASPLENISNTQRINAVVVNGRYLPQETLRKLLAEVEAAANGMKPR